jgi:hypothetical protein
MPLHRQSVGALIVRVPASSHALRSPNRLEGRPAADDSRRFPGAAALMSTIEELGAFLNRETAVVGALPNTPAVGPARNGEPAGS